MHGIFHGLLAHIASVECVLLALTLDSCLLVYTITTHEAMSQDHHGSVPDVGTACPGAGRLHGRCHHVPTRPGIAVYPANCATHTTLLGYILTKFTSNTLL